MTQFSSIGSGYAPSAPAEKQLLIRAKALPPAGTAAGVICLHGRSGDAATWQPSATPVDPGATASALAAAGMLVLSIDAGGPTAWSGPAVMSRISDAYALLTATLGAKAKIGLLGWSMGGLSALNWIKRNPAKVGAAWLYSPLTDLDWAHGTSGYTPAYSAFARDPAWASEIDAAFPTYATSSASYRVRDEYASWRLGIPIRIAHASDDTVVPPAASAAFVGGVADAAVTLRSPAPTGNHVAQFASVPTSEVVAHFTAAL